MQISELFKKTPWQWGLRGDPHLWKEMDELIGTEELPDTEEELIKKIGSAFLQLTGITLDHEKDIQIDKYDHGGMSRGMISMEFWREKAMGMFIEKYREIKNG